MNRKKRMMLILISLLLLLLIFNPKTITYLQEQFLGDEREVIDLMELELPHSSQMVYHKLDDQLLQYWDGILYSYSMDGSQNWSTNLSINNPTVETSKNSVYIIDKSKKQIIRINKQGETIYRTTLNDDIGFIEGKKDDVTLVYHTPDNSRFRKLSILNGEGKKIGDIVINDGEVVSTAISKDEERIILHTVGIGGGKLQTKLISYNLQGELLELKGIEDQLIVNMFFDYKGNLITAHENKLVSIDKSQEINWEQPTDKLIKVMDLSGEYIVTYGGEGKNSILQGRSREKIQVIDMEGNVIGESKPRESIMGMDYDNEFFIAYSDRSIYLYDKKCNMMMEHQLSVDIEKVFLLPQKHIAVISKEKLVFMKIQ
ncbi:DUF5711 family protein [Alkaliphilus hydrothermalis]|uniref:Uncharacterized protein n=1 Tax=Alkaliphilus hydrothermalis TaxID=1482730 RepID=A0ABS2NRJ8_9FIRM|nr:hypothetical protein [Alkaliphilus hydrothermalis]